MQLKIVIGFIVALSGLPVNMVAAADPYERPFGDNAPWNVPVAQILRHPDSQEYVRRLWFEASDRPGNINLSFDEYTYPVYDARKALRNYAVVTKWKTPETVTSVPWNPEWKPASGSDGQAIVLDPSTGTEWDLFQVQFDGTTVSATNANKVPGDYRRRETGYVPSRGAGIPYLAMLVRGEEVLQGEIRHALAMPVRNADGAVFFPPATKLEHPGSIKNGLPEGIRFALSVTDEEIAAWAASLPRELTAEARESAKVIARALRDYGWFVVDSGGTSHLQFEDRKSAGPLWQRAGLGHIEINGREYPRDLLDGLVRQDRIFALVRSDQYPESLKARPAN